MIYLRDEFVAYLEDTLIPDLKEAGQEKTAIDFEIAIEFINNPDIGAVDTEAF